MNRLKAHHPIRSAATLARVFLHTIDGGRESPLVIYCIIPYPAKLDTMLSELHQGNQVLVQYPCRAAQFGVTVYFYSHNSPLIIRARLPIIDGRLTA